MRFKAVLLAFALLATQARAEDSSDLSKAFKDIITHQLEALAKDDGATAFADAAPNIQGMFKTPDNFMGMVKNGYQPVYRNKTYAFGEFGTDALGRIVQKVEITGLDGIQYEASYFMEQQADGSWKISGCVLRLAPAAV